MLLTKQQMTSNSLALFCAPSCLTGDSKCRANLVFCPTFAHQTMNGTIRVLLGLLIAGCAACSQILLQVRLHNDHAWHQMARPEAYGVPCREAQLSIQISRSLQMS